MNSIQKLQQCQPQTNGQASSMKQTMEDDLEQGRLVKDREKNKRNRKSG